MRQQIACADVVIVNKTDLVTPAVAASVQRLLATELDKHSVLMCEHGQVPVEVLFGHGHAKPSAGHEADEVHVHASEHAHKHEGHGAGHSHDHGEAAHASDGFKTACFFTSSPLPLGGLQHFLQHDMPRSVVRAKGILRFAGRPGRQYVVHLCGRRYTFEERFDAHSSDGSAEEKPTAGSSATPAAPEGSVDAPAPGDGRATALGTPVCCQLVLIGAGIDAELLLAQFRAACPGVSISLETGASGAAPSSSSAPPPSASGSGASAEEAAAASATKATDVPAPAPTHPFEAEFAKKLADDVRFRLMPWPARGEVAFSCSGVMGIGAYIEGDRLDQMNLELAQGINMARSALVVPAALSPRHATDAPCDVVMTFAYEELTREAASGESAEKAANAAVYKLWKVVEAKAVPVLTQAFMESVCC